MGIDFHVLNFLQYAAKKKSFGDTITIGRQEMHIPSDHRYCERLLLEKFGASLVESIDNSGYEDATHIHDMNEPLPRFLTERYDTVIDAGTLEHIYNAPQALKNCSTLCRFDGQIIHVLPANNFCGHGFWQFSPELFFSLYTNANGYNETEVFVASLKDREWRRAREPRNGQRAMIVPSLNETYVLVRTVLAKTDFSHDDVQQSDYKYLWTMKGS